MEDSRSSRSWRGRQERGRRLLDQLLVPPLQRAVPGRDDHHVPVAVGQALRLHVPRPVQVTLDEALAAAERRDRLPHGGVKLLADLLGGTGHLQAAAAAAERRLDGDRQPVLGGERDGLLGTGNGPVGARRQRRADGPGDLPRRHLVAERLDGGRGRPDPGQAGAGDRPREVSVLGQEAVAGMHGVGPAGGGRPEDLGDVEVALGRALAAQGVGLVGHHHMQGIEILVGIDGHAGQPGVAACSYHPDRDLAPVGDEDLAHENGSSRLRRSLVRTGRSRRPDPAARPLAGRG